MKKLLFIIFLFSICSKPFAQEKPVRKLPTVSTDTTGTPTTKKKAIKTTPQESSGRIGSKVVDDSTRNIYGPTTSRWTTEKDIFYGLKNYRPVDTTILNYHRWTYVQKFNNFYQDLGNSGTALNPIFPTLRSETIGVDPGFNAYEKYFQTEEPVYYDTKSPYTRMYIIWGGSGRAATRIEFARNINPNWSLGFNYRPILTDKQIQRKGKGDRHVVSHYYDLYTHYTTPNEKYSALVAYRRIRHRVNENGGTVPIFPTGFEPDFKNNFDSTYRYYFEGNVRNTLTAASSIEQRNLLHLLHQYKIANSLRFYHEGNIYKQIDWYKENLESETEDFYDNQEIDTTLVLDSTQFSYLQNRVGFKGRIGKSQKIFYDVYYKIKSYNLFYKYLNVDTLALSRHSDEHYAGGQLQYAFDSLHTVSGWVEALEGGYYRLAASGNTKWVDFSYEQLKSKPTFLQTAYSGHFDFWSNEFQPPESRQISVFPKVTVGPLFISPGITYTALDNYIYFAQRDTFPGTSQKVLPLQAENKIQFATPELRMDLTVFKHFHLRPQILYSKILADTDSVLRVPEIFANAQISYENMLFKGNLQVQIGFDLFWRSAYKAPNYDPVIQNFYNQDSFTTPEYLLADFFLNGKMKRGRFFIKWHNFMQAFTTLRLGYERGYMPTPFYTGKKNIIDFGFDILLFD